MLYFIHSQRMPIMPQKRKMISINATFLFRLRKKCMFAYLGETLLEICFAADYDTALPLFQKRFQTRKGTKIFICTHSCSFKRDLCLSVEKKFCLLSHRKRAFGFSYPAGSCLTVSSIHVCTCSCRCAKDQGAGSIQGPIRT